MCCPEPAQQAPRQQQPHCYAHPPDPHALWPLCEARPRQAGSQAIGPAQALLHLRGQFQAQRAVISSCMPLPEQAQYSKAHHLHGSIERQYTKSPSCVLYLCHVARRQPPPHPAAGHRAFLGAAMGPHQVQYPDLQYHPSTTAILIGHSMRYPWNPLLLIIKGMLCAQDPPAPSPPAHLQAVLRAQLL